jgi:hypothetical protein
MGMIEELMAQVSVEKIRERVFYLAKDPLPFRKANYTIAGHAKSTLDEADDWIASQLETWGYAVRREACRVQAFACDRSKPAHHWYAAPAADAPFYAVHNLYAELTGEGERPEIILICAHKDSQSWIDSPGANDNEIGTAAAMEMARVLRGYKQRRSIHFLFCNEEHIPWTSPIAAAGYKSRGDKIVAMFNSDGVGVKGDEERLAGKMSNVSMYTAPEGKVLADLMAEVNERYGLGLAQSSRQRQAPGDDDGSFVKAGFPCAIVNFGAYPYGDPEYHLPGDAPERVDYANAALTCKAMLAAVLTLDQRN